MVSHKVLLSGQERGQPTLFLVPDAEKPNPSNNGGEAPRGSQTWWGIIKRVGDRGTTNFWRRDRAKERRKVGCRGCFAEEEKHD